MSKRIDSATQLPTMHRRMGGPDRFASQEKAKDAKGTLLRIIKLFGTSKKAVIIAVILTLVSSLIAVFVPYFVGKAFNFFTSDHKLINDDLLLTTLAIIGIMHISTWLVNSLSSWILLDVSQKLVFVFRARFFDKMQKLPLIFYDTQAHGDMMSRIANDADNISSTITQATTNLLSSVLTVIDSLAIMLSLNVTLTMAVLVAVPLVTILTRLITVNSKKYFSAQQKSLGSLNSVIEENITGIKIVKAFGKQDDVLKRFTDDNTQLYNSSVQAQIWAGYMMPLMNVINNLIFSLVALTGGYLAATTVISTRTVISFLTYSKQFAHPLNSIAGMFSTIQQALASAERIFETLDEVEETPDKPDAVTIKNPKGNITFDRVSFSYNKEKPVLTSISFEVKAGEVIAIVGETGSGKTTIINLLNRFYDVDGGNIYLDGINIQNIKRSELRQYFSVVLQETSLFSGTIMDNIRYARPDAADQEVIKAAKIAHADEFITRLPQGYSTYISAVNDNLSEGQKQLLAISRAVLCHCPVLILDEATSSVDTKTEKEIQMAMIALMKNHTSFLIAHRLSTIKDADRILVVKDGIIFENGNHDQLMDKKGYYYRMVRAQMGRKSK